MNDFSLLDPRGLTENPFALIGDDWALLTAGDSPADYNTMTVSWGSMGILWGRPVATVYVRPQRYTREFMEKSDFFTLSFFGGEYRKELGFCGSKSGRDFDKAKECGLTPFSPQGGAEGVSFAEARLILCCKKLYWNDIDPANFVDPTLDGANYPARDYHRLYVGEITGVFAQEEHTPAH